MNTNENFGKIVINDYNEKLAIKVVDDIEYFKGGKK